jgi:CobQ-like glutamine amidotransferase family enzyme
LRAWADDGVPFLAIAGGWQLLGRTLTVESGETWEGAGVFPSDSVLSGTRIVGEVFTDDAAGFENHSAQTVILEGEEFAGGRGLRVGDRVATTLHGPFLPMNPSWADRLLSVSAARAGVAWGADDERLRQVDEYAARSREAIRARLGV